MYGDIRGDEVVLSGGGRLGWTGKLGRATSRL